MPSFSSASQTLPENAALGEVREPSEDLVMAIKDAIRHPLGSHTAVHLLQEKVKEDFRLRMRVRSLLGNTWLPEKLSTLWNVTYDSASKEEIEARLLRQKEILYDIGVGKRDLYELIPYEILNCPKCYEFCFGTEKPDDFFFCIAAKAEKPEERNHVLFRCPPQLLLRMSLGSEEWLKICRENFPDLTWQPLTQKENDELFTSFEKKGWMWD
ncbi:hypothetical protein N7490_006763 [Penicillium lividum]|nr:hypothetical protein N7490_006763 [Penicillium lividum]